MHYYLVMVTEVGYQKPDPLTYVSARVCSPGDVVTVPFGRKSVAAIVIDKTPKPLFETKQIGDNLTSKPLPAQSLQLIEWMTKYYPSGSGALASLFVPSGLAQNRREPKADTKKVVSKELPPLTTEQLRIVDEIKGSKKRSFLLHGETGTGKTRVYMERARVALEAEKSVLVLTPEIALVPQLADTFRAVFGDRVVVIHSGLGKSARNRNWLRILEATEPLIVIGTRSALFAPLQNTGLIVVDEMHEPAYKQEQAPYHYGLRVAGQLARLYNAEIIYGSATPPVVEYYIAEATESPILRMTETALVSTSIKKTMVDLKDSKQFGRHQYFSDDLLAAITKRLAQNEQSLLFHNRRGTARLVICQTCGWQAVCPQCDTALVYHNDTHLMRCHTCGYSASPPYSCPTCQSDDILYRSLGTKALVDVLQQFFPEAIIKRFDTDNTAEEQLARNYDDVREGKVDILVGTQMLGKGLDLPRLSLVGVINADSGLSMPDYSSSERNYQLLHQAIGRVGRGHIDGEVIVQSFNPESPVLQAALRQDWHAMYTSELAERRQFRFPPFAYILKISVGRKTAASAEQFAKKLHRAILDMSLPVQANEPTPSFYERSGGRYNWQIIIKAKQRGQLVDIVTRLPKGDYSYDLDPINLF